jgi:predicted membrane channel-forming protein YqfA (hemolysin III family)
LIDTRRSPSSSLESKQFFEDINELYLQLKARLQTYPEGPSSLAAALKAVKDKIDDHLPVFLEKWPLEIFIFSAFFCFAASSVMHLLWVRSLKVCNLTHNIDLSGISFMIFGSSYGFIYYIFKCDYWSYYVYFSIQLFSLLGVLLCINCKIFNKEKYQTLKVILFMLQASSMMISALHWRLMK